MQLKAQERNAEARPIYDTYELASAQNTPAEVTLFATPFGGTKTKAETNLPRPYQIGAGDLFHMLALRVVPIGMDEADILNWMKKYTVEFLVDGKLRLQAPMEYFAGGAGLAGFATTTATTTTIKHVTNGVPDPRAIASIPRDLEILIGGGNTFKCLFVGTTFGPTTAATFIRVYLDGVWEEA